jgi:hypothetical protein
LLPAHKLTAFSLNVIKNWLFILNSNNLSPWFWEGEQTKSQQLYDEVLSHVVTRWTCANSSVLPVAVAQIIDHLCGLVIRVPAYESRGPGPIPGATRFSEK